MIDINWGVVGQVFVPIVVAALAAWATRAAHRTQKGSRENALIDQLQEQLLQADKRADKQDERMEKIEAKLEKVGRTSRVRLDYIYRLRHHIDTGQPPPAPEWPAGIHD
ncbi:hypothetical protein AFL94_08720 [Arthrobacter sp. LS16]|nr:hypothetical protein AFL94_08720 [Arthrobacter sp. LS16]